MDKIVQNVNTVQKTYASNVKNHGMKEDAKTYKRQVIDSTYSVLMFDHVQTVEFVLRRTRDVQACTVLDVKQVFAGLVWILTIFMIIGVGENFQYVHDFRSHCV